MTIATFIEYLSEGQMNTCSNWKEESQPQKHSMSIKIYIAVLLLPRVRAKVRVRDSLTDVMSSSALKQGMDGGGGGGGGGGSDPAAFPVLFYENPVSRLLSSLRKINLKAN